MKPDTLPLYENDLPPTARTLVRLCGWRKAMALIREMRGARIYCPAAGFTRNADMRFAQVEEIIGYNATQRLYAAHKGSYIEVPNCRRAFELARDRYIKQCYDSGASVEDLCRETGLSRRRIFAILKVADQIPAGNPHHTQSGQMWLFK